MPRLTSQQKKVLRELLREAALLRDKNKCIRCGHLKRLSTSHIYPKGRYKTMEYDLDNVKILCYSCHLQFWHKNPIEAKEWLDSKLPKERLQRLKLMSQTSRKMPNYNSIKLYLEQEIKCLSNRQK